MSGAPRHHRQIPSLVGAFAFLAASAAPGLAQAHRNPAVPDSLRHIQSVVPRSGPPGTLVEISTKNLPLQAQVVIGVGAIGTGFEELVHVEQGELGEVSASVRVPESATWDRSLRFIIFNGNFVPTALSDPFHVTDGEGMIRRRGHITSEGTGCVTLQGEDDDLYVLTGAVGHVEPGDEVTVDGTYVAFEASGGCPGGDAIDVVRLVHVP